MYGIDERPKRMTMLEYSQAERISSCNWEKENGADERSNPGNTRHAPLDPVKRHFPHR